MMTYMHPAAPLSRPIKRHHTAHYYAHRVKESLTTRVSKLVCSIFLTLVFLVGIITFILWLSLRPHRPRFHVQDFSLPGLAQDGAAPGEAQIILYNLTARNPNQNIGVHYDSLDVAVFYGDEGLVGPSSAEAQALPSFYQGPKNTTAVAGRVAGPAVAGMWGRFVADRARGEVVFRVEVTSVIRFKISTWDSKRHTMHVRCPVGVGPDGLLLPSYRVNRCPVYFS
ncbi:Late embryogenesis abundant (LEA) hydroxyproline-rich glycoprotein family [Striga hermonthica]|uniref:Late embryogenesis abundant (LEA) hydroxyproline-rich glycoprotein family n=1 Tax=Striga hermonthica TaxID=68872 RepID=A0A9N7N883_STRHE|nr:Late embryogenesis abundant (LEA) hydroxyproline-rich glycoprotein family [Striga hermonthica]